MKKKIGKKKMISIIILFIMIIYLFRNYIKMDLIFLVQYRHFANVIELVKADEERMDTLISSYKIRDGELVKNDEKKNVNHLKNGVYYDSYDMNGVLHNVKMTVEDNYVWTRDTCVVSEESELAKELIKIYGGYEDIANITIYVDYEGDIAAKFPIASEGMNRVQETREYDIVYVEPGFDGSIFTMDRWTKIGIYNESQSDYGNRLYWYRWIQDYSNG